MRLQLVGIRQVLQATLVSFEDVLHLVCESVFSCVGMGEELGCNATSSGLCLARSYGRCFLDERLPTTYTSLGWEAGVINMSEILD